MNILQIGSADSIGGAAKVSYRLKKVLDIRNIPNWLVVGNKNERNQTIFELPHSNRFQQRLNRILHTEGLGRNTFKELQSLPFWNEVDLIHFHNLHSGFFNIFDLPKISRVKPCLWTLHDPWILSHKEKIVPEYKNIFPFENLFFNFAKKIAIDHSSIKLVTPSKWLQKKVLQEYPRKDVQVISNGVDTKIFAKTNQKEARLALKLPLDKKIFLFVAQGGKENTGKGATFLDTVEQYAKSKNCIILSLGGKDAYIESEKILSLYYSAADLLIFPSLAENLPLVVLESMACETPVVAFETGGIPEIIDHKKNGYVAKYKNSTDLIIGIDFVLNNANKDDFGKEARKKIMTYFNLDLITENYIDLYRTLATKNEPSNRINCFRHL